MRFDQKRVVITGGVGGIGQTLVRLFTNEGADVMFSDRSEEDCNDLYQAMKRDGLDTRYLAGDLRNKLYCETLIKTAVSQLGGIDILLNNAGIIPRGTILETTDEMWFSALDVNLTAVFYLSRAAIPYMQKVGGGAIVNTSSTWGIYPGPGHLAYCTSKGALAAMTRCMGRDHAPDNIRVNAVCPNEVNTPMLRSGFSRRGIDPDNAIAELGKSVPLGHVAEPEEIADVIAFLASQDARYICGETIEVSGAKPVYG
ncbi:MAG: NAD(P)-dependent dehydrogenase (short-subunit alcohol dehydrogenase family) [Gammaproteobacteria bacterium]|jgi:NAD(P)-dependent dehydrogenase (short-subunit alcohol dehydrogenase family)